MRNLRFAAVAALAGLVVTGCGDETDPSSTPSPGPSSPAPTSPAPSTAPSSSTPTGGALPLTVTRTGGFAGFDDRVVIGTDGVATVSRRGKDPVKCRVDASLLTELTDAVQQVDWTAVGSTKPTVRHPDDMIIAVASGRGLARLEDPRLRPLTAPVTKLLTEAAAAPGKLCKPV
ncbi:hypothetical protein [Kribbella flavida]|uniref:hypothetical protein n=1 Tax=Kribbella flavida TaxID=182640 RepID=UPI00019BCDE9|nr:hypothetical protein [Kribbella flavida]